jgi:hypothetical protein
MIASLLFFFSLSLACGVDALSMSQEQAILSLNGTAFQDDNRDGFFSAGEAALSGASVRLIHEDTETGNATTDETGQYAFVNLTPGRYELRADPFSGNNQTAPGGEYYEVTLSDKPCFGLDFGFFASGNLTTSLPEREYPLMHFSPDEMSEWTSQYNVTPQAYLSPEIAAKIASAPPSSYSLLSLLKYTPSERDQGTCGNCWVWAGTGVMEIDYARQKGIKDRFSVQYLDSNYNGGWGKNGACCGGWLEYLANFYQSKKIIVPWSNANAHYRDGAISCGGRSPSASTISTDTHYDLSSISASTIPARGLAKETAISNIKNVLLQDKAIWFAFFLPDKSSWDDFYNFWGTKPESAVWQPDFACGSTYSYSSGGGHAVLCVGYNDSDPSNRYWIMLNSWGTTAGRPGGFFRVNMDMNYNCTCSGLGYAFYWMTLNMSYAVDTNHPPQTPATPQGPAGGPAGSSLTYSTSTTDPDGDPVRFTFNWADGTTTKTAPSTTGIGSASHVWNAKGDYSVKAMATDSKGATSSWSNGLQITVTAANRLPSRPTTPAGPVTGNTEKSYKFTSQSTDPDGDDVQLIFDWGDASQTTTAFFKSGETISATHTWTQAGTHSVKAMAVDKRGGQSGWSAYQRIKITKIINLPPRNPTQPAGVANGLVGKGYFFVGYSTDPNGNKIFYTFDWGDGEITETTLATSGISMRASHAWSQAGAYEVRIMATDSNGATSGWSMPKKVVMKNSISPAVLAAIRKMNTNRA